MGYRLAMILSGGVALIWTDPQQGGGWSWPQVYRLMAGLMVVTAVASATLLPRLPRPEVPRSLAREDLTGFLAVSAAAVAGYLLTQHLWSPLASALLLPWLQGTALATACSSAGPTWPPCCWAWPPRCRWPPGRPAGRVSTPCCRAWPATSASPAPGPSWA
jgi:hypothetical protein